MSSNARVSSNSAKIGEQLPPIYWRLLDAKAQKGLTFADLGKALGRDEVWVAAAFYGQAKFKNEDLIKLSQTLSINQNELQADLGEHWFPQRGLGPIPPTDPLIYRLFEGILVYGQPLKAIIHEKFGDGIMSMINCKVHVERKPDPEGDRVLLTFDGKFLPSSVW